MIFVCLGGPKAHEHPGQALKSCPDTTPSQIEFFSNRQSRALSNRSLGRPDSRASFAAGAKSLCAPHGVAQFLFDYFAGEEGMFQQLRDLVAFAYGIRLVTEVFHEYDQFAPVAGIDDSGIAHQALFRHTRAGLDDATRGRHKLNCDSGVYTGGATCRQRDVLGRIKIVTDVFSGMCYCGQHRDRGESFDFEHAHSFCQMSHHSGSAPQVDPQVPYFSEAAVRKVLRYDDLIPAMERALIDFSTGKVLQPVRGILPVEQYHGLFGIMPAVYGDIMGAKLVTLFAGNSDVGLPTHQGIIVLLRATTGEPLAVLDGRLITEMRTAAVTAAATKLLADPDARVLAILGSGVQARAHWTALRLVRQFREVRIWSRTPNNAQALAEEIGGTAMSAEDAVRGADVVVTVANVCDPILFGRWLKPGALVNAVGAVGGTKRELDDAAMQGSVVVDSREAAMVESGDVLLSGAAVYAELGEILAGKRPKPSAGTTVFKSLGLAVEDLAAARLVLQSLRP